MPQAAPTISTGHPAPPRTDAEAERRAFYSSPAWRKASKTHLRLHPLCVDCEAAGRSVPATQVNHIVDRLDAPERALDPTNFESLCGSHHSRKTAKRQRRRFAGGQTA